MMVSNGKRSLVHRRRGWVAGRTVLRWVSRARARANLRRVLAGSDFARISADVGVSRSDLEREAVKPFWRN